MKIQLSIIKFILLLASHATEAGNKHSKSSLFPSSMRIIHYLRNAGLSLLLMNMAVGVSAQKQPVDYVNPYIGNISHLLVPTFPTIHLPNSLLRVYPERGDFTGDLLRGLPLVVTSHRGSSAFNLSPFQGDEKEIRPVISYSYDQEKITPYSYSVFLDEQQIGVGFALSHQSALYELNFTRDRPAYLVMNSRNGGLRWDGEAVSGYQSLENNTRVFLYLKPEQTPESISLLKENSLKTGTEAKGKNACVVLKYAKGTKTVRLKYGISFINEAQARENLEREIQNYDLAALQKKGRAIWNESLGKIVTSGGTDNERTIFYTSFYRTFERPVCISEDGRYYSAFDGTIHNDNGTPFFTDDWIWDAYRAHHPLRVLIDPKKEENILHSFIEMAGQMENHWMPTFPEITGDSRRMNSNHGVASVIDAYRKGLRGFDLEKAYQACKGGITEKTLAPWSGKHAGKLDQFYKEHGYIPALKVGEEESIPEVHSFERRQPVAVTLGTSYDEWCLSQIAKELGKTDDYQYFLKCSYNFRNLFNSKTGFFHPKDSDGKFIEPFDYVFSGGMGAREYYGENNGWIYRWDVQHNIADLIRLMGGNDTFVKNLDRMFSEPLGRGKYAFYAQLPDQTGNVGQFSLSNEPALHIPYMYNYAGQPWKTQKRIRTLLNQWFRNDLMGVPGDEDGGGMTSFVVFSYMGFYPVTPGMPVYNIGSPIFSKVRINVGNGKFFEVEAVNNSSENKYIQSASLNGKSWNKPWFSHSDLASGGKLILKMGPKANQSWGSSENDAPPSAEKYD
jgi:predicted alpha-1,2-mannosidase